MIGCQLQPGDPWRRQINPDSPVVGDCVVELVGLEPTTKVLWNMVGVRPTPKQFSSPPVPTKSKIDIDSEISLMGNFLVAVFTGRELSPAL